MQFTVDRMKLYHLVSKLARITPDNHQPHRELECIYVRADADSGTLCLTGTNPICVLQCTLPAQVAESGVFLLHGRLFERGLSLLDGDTVLLRQEREGRVVLQCDSVTYEFAVLPAAGYPMANLAEPAQTVRIRGIPTLYRRVEKSVSRAKGDAPIFKGIRLDTQENRIRFTASDKFRMCDVVRPFQTGGVLDAVLPQAAMHDLAEISDDKDEYVFGITSEYGMFTRPGFVFAARLLSGRYFDTDKVYTAVQPAYSATVDRNKLAEALTCVSVAAQGTGKLNLCFGEDEITFYTSYDGTFSSMSVAASITREMEPAGFWYSPGYLMDMFRTLCSDILILDVSETGVLVAHDTYTRYMVPAVQPPSKAEKQKQPKKTKPSPKKKSAAKAEDGQTTHAETPAA